MEEKTVTRIGIIASVIGAVGALAYLIRGGPQAVYLTGGPGMGPANAGTPGTPGLPGTAGAAGAAGAPGTPGPAGMNTVPGTGDAITNIDNSTMQTVTQNFLSQFFPPAAGPRPTLLSYNAPIASDLGKLYMGEMGKDAAKSGGKSGCGCGGGKKGGCGGHKNCPNAQPPYKFTDGAGGCMSSSYGALVEAMEKCAPGFTDAMVKNMASNTQYYGYDTPDGADLVAAIRVAGSRSGEIHDYLDATAPGIRLGTN